MPLIEQLLGEMDERPEEAKRLARRLAADLASEEGLRSLLLEALLREAATREDLEKLGDRLEARIEKLRAEMKTLAWPPGRS